MTTKLTLSVEKEVVEKAKLYAKRTGRSLSEIIEGFLETLTSENAQKSNKTSPKLRKIIGVVKLPKNFNEENAKRAHLENKHL
ncbi:MAG TPA: DUF6364 family protein [Saprospiraceae bacterium]|nr:DUF6364 family protein [Saprospiraceae bacterium]